MIISYIILAHKEPVQVQRLVQRLCTRDTYFYIHVDINVDITPFQQVLKNCNNVFLLKRSRRVASTWGSPGLVQATLHAINQIIDDRRFGYCVLLSGQCYPLKSNEKIAAFFEEHNGINFIEGFRLPDLRWGSTITRLQQYTFFLTDKKGDFISLPSLPDQTLSGLFKTAMIKKYLKVLLHDPIKAGVLFQKRKIPYGLQPYGGMQWWALPIDTLHFIIHYLDKNSGYLKYHMHTLFSDEVFFQTIVYNYCNNIKDSVAYSPWPGIDISSSPKTFTLSDFDLLISRPELFARKFDYDVDKAILDRLDENFYPAKVNEASYFTRSKLF